MSSQSDAAAAAGAAAVHAYVLPPKPQLPPGWTLQQPSVATAAQEGLLQLSDLHLHCRGHLRLLGVRGEQRR